MTGLSRRSFLRGAVASALGAGVMPLLPRASRAWGELPAGLGIPKYRVLDIVMPGGASQWESFCVTHDGPGGATNWRGLEDVVMGLQWENGPEFPSPGETNPFLNFGDGSPMLSWGPATKPLWRPDIMNRSRMVLTRHTLEVHGLGLFLNLTGRDFGRPRAACLGAPIQRHFLSGPDPLEIPYSYVLAPNHLGREYILSHATAIGQHPGPARPLALRVGEGIGELLNRNGVSTDSDDVTNALRDEYHEMLRFQGEGDRLRSSSLDSYEGAARYLENAEDLHPILGGDAMLAPDVLPACQDSTSNDTPVANTTRRSLELAAELFENGARHVTVVDGGINHGGLRDSSFPYDGHLRDSKNVVEMTSAHLFNLCQSLATVIAEPGAGSGDGTGLQGFGPATIDLDNTIVRIFTEFGRTPNPGFRNVDGYAACGREHFPAVNYQILIGGPINHRGLQGWVGFEGGDPNTAVPHEALTATDLWAGMLIAAGVDPFSADDLTTGDDFSGVITADGNTPAAIRNRLLEDVLGHSFWI